MTKLIGIVGWAGSGKDTAANFLVKNHNYRRESFASSLKDAVAAIFHWPRNMLEGHTEESRKWREEVDTWWAKRLGIPNLTPRYVLQHIGTDVLRREFHDDIWVASLEYHLMGQAGRCVLSDVRFPNEVAMIKKLNGKIVHIMRGKSPEWFSNWYDDYEDLKHFMEKWHPEVHPSEYMWTLTKFDRIIRNDGTLAELEAEVNDLVY